MSRLTDAIREATLAAGRLHKHLGLKEDVEDSARINVFEAASRIGLPLLLKPLDSLLGAYICDPSPGALVTTQRPLSIQRFTAAHELGHHWMRHQPSYDDESILRRAPFPEHNDGDFQEVEANAFAAAFLLPIWLVDRHCKQQGWTNKSLSSPDIAYQLSLRAGLSYEATCWTLQRYKILTSDQAKSLIAIEPKSLKKKLLGSVTPENFYGDVWRISEKDEGLPVEGSAADYIVLHLLEHGASGYLWNIAEHDPQLSIVFDDRESLGEAEAFGGANIRRLITHPIEKHSGELALVEERPWDPSDNLARFKLIYHLHGAEREGLSRAEKRLRLGAG